MKQCQPNWFERIVMSWQFSGVMFAGMSGMAYLDMMAIYHGDISLSSLIVAAIQAAVAGYWLRDCVMWKIEKEKSKLIDEVLEMNARLLTEWRPDAEKMMAAQLRKQKEMSQEPVQFH